MLKRTSKILQFTATICLFGFSLISNSQIIPFIISNNSIYYDNEIYIGIVGIQQNIGHVWIDCKTSTVNPLSVADNTITGPSNGGNMGPGGNAKYANCFTKLSDIPNKTINIPSIAGTRILIAFKQQLYLYFFGASGAPSGYAAPNLANPTDPNQGIRYEMIELTNASNGLWTNTTRVDTYQYPMGLEVWGANAFYKKVGELKTHDQIISEWKATVPVDFVICLDTVKGIIKFPTKNENFNTNYFKGYIDSIWTKYASAKLVFDAGDVGIWTGSVVGEEFKFTRSSDNASAIITRRPTTIEVMEGSGVLASGTSLDKVIQAEFCAALNRHALDLNIASDVKQIWSDDSKYYSILPYNFYSKFWHQADISYQQYSYAFCYDDVFDKSSTINAPAATSALITIGGFASAITQVNAIDDANGFVLYPNPATTTISIDNARFIKDQLFSVYDMNGQLLIQQMASQSHANIDISSITPGMYYVELKTATGLKQRKFIKQ